MFDLSQVPAPILMARGQYATVRSAHEDKKKELAKLCSSLQWVAAQVLKAMQPDEDAVPVDTSDLIAAGRDALSRMEQTAQEIESLARQRAELKRQAWK